MELDLNYCIASEIFELIEDEGEANKGYTALLAKFGTSLSFDTINEIKEIIAEENKHILMLYKIAKDLTGIGAEEITHENI